MNPGITCGQICDPRFPQPSSIINNPIYNIYYYKRALPTMASRFLDTLSGKIHRPAPVWLMRQAGRYMAEYRALRSSEPDFISFCLNSDKAAEVTLQPIHRFGFDAAIIFSDILLVPWALKRNVRFVTGTGPLLDPLENVSDIDVSSLDALKTSLAPVGEAITKTRAALPVDTALIGFAGAPWTIITYMLEGQSSRDFPTARKWAWANNGEFDALLDIVTEATIEFLALQADAGADALMLFDSWASAVPALYRDRIVSQPAARIISSLRKRGITQPVIGFPKGIGEGLVRYCEITGVQAVGVDHGTDLAWAVRELPKDIVLQGNLDPLSLIDGGQAMQDAVTHILDVCDGRPHIFNLGHGITPETPMAHVDALISIIRG